MRGSKPLRGAVTARARRLARACRERPGDQPAQKRDDLAPPHAIKLHCVPERRHCEVAEAAAVPSPSTMSPIRSSRRRVAAPSRTSASAVTPYVRGGRRRSWNQARYSVILERCDTGARRLQVDGLVALVRRAPAQLDAVVDVVGHLEQRDAVDHVLERQRPWRTVGARIGELARRELRGEHAVEFGLDVGDALVLRHRIALGRRATRSGKSRTTSMAISSRRSRDGVAKSSHAPVVSKIDGPSGMLASPLPLDLVLAAVLDRGDARLHLLFERGDRLLASRAPDRAAPATSRRPCGRRTPRPTASTGRARSRRTGRSWRSRRWSGAAACRSGRQRSAGSA